MWAKIKTIKYNNATDIYTLYYWEYIKFNEFKYDVNRKEVIKEYTKQDLFYDLVVNRNMDVYLMDNNSINIKNLYRLITGNKRIKSIKNYNIIGTTLRIFKRIPQLSYTFNNDSYIIIRYLLEFIKKINSRKYDNMQELLRDMCISIYSVNNIDNFLKKSYLMNARSLYMTQFMLNIKYESI